MDNDKRRLNYKKNSDLELLFLEMEAILGSAEQVLLSKFNQPTKPVIFIVGCARSGTTLVYQYLASTGLFGYPTNLMSRFYYAPYIGARINQMLIDYDEKGEILGQHPKTFFESNLGKTSGATQPHEFWYFWNRFFKFGKLQQMSNDEVIKSNWSGFLNELHAMEFAIGKPLLMKAMNMNWHLMELTKNVVQSHIIFVVRNVLHNAQSLLLARNKFFGNLEEWYSFKPHNYEEIKKLPYFAQVVEQVISTNESIYTQLGMLHNTRYTVVNYEDFCKNASGLLRLLKEKGVISNSIDEISFNTTFDVQNYKKLPAESWQKLEEYYSKRKNKCPSPSS